MNESQKHPSFVVFGGAGYIGRGFVAEILRRGCNVTVCDLAAERVPKGAAFRMVDIRDEKAVREVVQPNCCVVNFAGISSLNVALDKPREVIETNVVGNINILEACKAVGVEKYCFASSAYVYSLHGSFYRISKRTCEEYIIEYQRRYGLDFIILRYGSLFGGESDESNGMHRIVEGAIKKGEVRYSGEETDSREFIHIDDASAICADLILSEARNRAYLLTGSERITMRQLFELLQEILARPLKMQFGGAASDSHYRMTQYNFAPIEARKVFRTEHVDIGNGLLRLIERLHLANSGELDRLQQGFSPDLE
jgi:UDP-glucose 4-epimerase